MVIFLGIIFCCNKNTNDVTVKKVRCIIKKKVFIFYKYGGKINDREKRNKNI